MKYKPEHEKQLITDLLSFSHDPHGFVLYNYPWGQPGPLQQFDGPRAWQRDVLQAIKTHVCEQQVKLDIDDALEVYQEAIASGRGIGKSALFGMLADWMISCHIGAAVDVTANTESQLRTKTFPEFGRWFTMGMNAHWWRIEGLGIYPRDWLATLVNDQLQIDPKYWRVQGLNWSEENPEAFAGTHNTHGLALFMDEASGIPEPVWKVAKGFFTEVNPFRLWIAFSQDRRNTGAFHSRLSDPTYSKYWRRRRIDARTVEGTDKSTYEEIIATFGPDSDEAKVEVYGKPPEQSSDQFISSISVMDAQKRELPHPAVDNDEPLIMGVDPAPRGRTVIRYRQGRDARSIQRTVLNGANNTEIVNAIVAGIELLLPDAIVVDAGQGTGVIDECRRRGIRVYEVWFGAAPEGIHRKSSKVQEEWATLGTELWACMRDWLPTGSIDRAPELARDLVARTWRWHGREENKKILTPKDVMAKEGIPSPDDGDALALTFYARGLRRRQARMDSITAGAGPRVAFDPHEDLI